MVIVFRGSAAGYCGWSSNAKIDSCVDAGPDGRVSAVQFRTPTGQQTDDSFFIMSFQCQCDYKDIILMSLHPFHFSLTSFCRE